MKSKGQHYPFPYAERAAAVRAALQAASDATRGRSLKRRDDETKAAVELARQNYRAAVVSAYHPDFWTVIDKLKSNEHADIDVVIDFLEADPIFFGSGYVKARVARLLQHVKLSGNQTTRLKDVLLKVIRRGHTHEFREFCRLAYSLREDALCEELERIAVASDTPEAHRAKWMLIAIQNRRFNSLTYYARSHKY